MSDETKQTEEAPVVAMTDEVKKETTEESSAPPADATPAATTATPAAEETPAVKEEDVAAAPTPEDDEATKTTIAAFTERIQFFFSNANLRQDKWMRTELFNSGCLTLDCLFRFKTIKKISTDKKLLGRAAAGEDAVGGERLKKLISYDAEKGEVRRVVPFDMKTMGSGSALSLYVKNVPLTQPPKKEEEKKEEGAADEAKKEEDTDKMDEEKPKQEDTKPKQPEGNFRPRYAVTRDEIKALFEPFGHVGIVQLRMGKKTQGGGDDMYKNPNNRGFSRGESYPLGVAIVEFESQEGLEKACAELVIKVDDRYKKDDEDEKKQEEENKGRKELELKGNTLVIEKMGRDSKNTFWDEDGKSNTDSNNNENNKRTRDEEPPAKIEFEPVTLDWTKGCVIDIQGVSTTACDRESIRDAVSEILDVTTDVKTSGMYVDYSRGEDNARLRLKEPKPDKMTALIDKLVKGEITIAGEKVKSAKILEGEEEEKYWNDFIAFLNNRKRMREEERFQSRKQGKFNGGGGRGRGRGGRGGGFRGRGGGGGRGGRGRGGRGRR